VSCRKEQNRVLVIFPFDREHNRDASCAQNRNTALYYTIKKKIRVRHNPALKEDGHRKPRFRPEACLEGQVQQFPVADLSRPFLPRHSPYLCSMSPGLTYGRNRVCGSDSGDACSIRFPRDLVSQWKIEEISHVLALVLGAGAVRERLWCRLFCLRWRNLGRG